MIVSVFVAGDPKPAGSKRAFVIPAKGDRKARAVITDSVDTKGAGGNWRADVRAAVAERLEEGFSPFDGPLLIRAIFYLRRPKGDYRKDGSLTSSAPAYHTKTPDATKLLRAVEDALIGLAYDDDKQIVTQIVQKRYADDGRVGASIMLGPLEEFAERALVDLRPPTCYSAANVPERRSEVDDDDSGGDDRRDRRRGRAVRDVPVRP